MNRRLFLSGLLAGLGCSQAPAPVAKTILLRSGWQTENIGDIAHTPGVLHLLDEHLPAAKIILWSNALDHGVGEMLARRFPKLEIVSGEPGDMTDAFNRADFLLHGSGPSVVAWKHVEAWREHSDKPYGIFGVTITLESEAASTAMGPELRSVIEGARFVFTRETRSLENLQKAGIEGPELGFVPDGTFSVDVRNDAAALSYLEENGLEDKRFIAVIPRLRYTPYHEFKQVDWSQEKIDQRTAVNEAHAEADHAKLRVVIERWIRETGGKALLCPEMTYETGIIDPLLYEPLPEDVKPSVVRRKEYWLTDMAASVYARAAAVVSFECHSPIIAASMGTPCFYVHQPEDGIKGTMWKDVGMQSFEVEQDSGDVIAEAVLAVHADPAAAHARVKKAVEFARERQRFGMERVAVSLGI
jgi:polysaccharide pyruvyl transferase WcaK-like protein